MKINKFSNLDLNENLNERIHIFLIELNMISLIASYKLVIRFQLTSGILNQSLWRNRLARSAVNRKVGGSNPPRDDIFCSVIFSRACE